MALTISATTRARSLDSSAIAERIEDLELAIESTQWLLEREVYFNDRFLLERLSAMKGELLDLKNVGTTK